MEREKIIRHAETMIGSGEEQALLDAFELVRTLETDNAVTVYGRGKERDTVIYDQENFDAAHRLNRKIRQRANDNIKLYGETMLNLYYKTHLFDAPHYFDSFCLYIEKDREPRRRFYLPRRKQLLPCVEALQDLEEGKIELLGISEPPGVGKTTLAEFFLAWAVGRNPFLPNLIGSHNNSFLTGMYSEMLRILDPGGEYRWSDVFPGMGVVATNAKTMMIGVGYTKEDDSRFKSIELTSIGSGNAGRVRAMNYLYCDDLVPDIETAMSRERLDKLWQQYYTDLRQRKVGTRCKELHIATRWSLHDVIGRLEADYEGDPRARFIRFPALDENDESNFNYPYGLGYSTEDLLRQRDIMDDASWRALYMNEPIERQGVLFDPGELQYFTQLPDAEPDAVIAVCDTKEQGNDFCAMPVLYQYGTMYYVNSFICDNGKVEVVQDRVAQRLVDEKVKLCQIESNRGGTLFANAVKDRLKELGGFTSITTKWTQTNKNTRIQVNSAWAKSHFFFRDPQDPDTPKEYRDAMRQLFAYSMVGKVAHDDVADVLSLTVEFILSRVGNAVKIIRRPF